MEDLHLTLAPFITARWLTASWTPFKASAHLLGTYGPRLTLLHGLLTCLLDSLLI